MKDFSTKYVLESNVPFQQTFVLMKSSWRLLSSSSSEDVFKTSWSRRMYSPYSYVFRWGLQDVFIKTNIFLLVIRLQDVLRKRLEGNFKAFSTHLQDIFITSCKNVFKTSSRLLAKMSSRRFQDVLSSKLFLVTQF